MALSLTRYFGAADLTRLGGGDAVYFSVPALGLLHYPAAWALPIALLVLAVLIGALIVAHQRGMVRWRRTGWGAAAMLVALVAATLAVTALWRGAMLVVPGETGLQSRLATSIPVLVVALVLAVGIGIGCIVAARRRATALELSIVPVAVWTLLACVTAALVPGASWIFTWPAAGASLALAFAIDGTPRRTSRAAGCVRGDTRDGACPAPDLAGAGRPPHHVVTLCAGAMVLVCFVATLPLQSPPPGHSDMTPSRTSLFSASPRDRACIRHPAAFGLAAGTIVVWAVTGPLFRYSDTGTWSSIPRRRSLPSSWCSSSRTRRTVIPSAADQIDELIRCAMAPRRR